MSEVHLDDAVQSALQEVMEDDYPLLLDAFVSDSEVRLREIRAGLANADREAVRLAAHSLKGSCSNMGAARLLGLCVQIEECARHGDLARVAVLFEQADAEFGTVCSLLGRRRLDEI
ncbi:Hpt domain-containing protein [Pseudomonas schmalbachii]|uniref:Hpt domain-containing protein n=1 Tax=Pseudomonas schmalbachii TaxID=2816993 RepID=A0ABS3TT85_9PSED|nr:Hpt domain-containing protein [Pseudomonas schmalbachii]MBO3275774.1 Hpt domain-containing protein [Pseudomonas schmalbachii]